MIVLQLGISSAFFRFYFDTKDAVQRLVVVRTSFWFTMTTATVGLVIGLVFANPIGHALQLGHDPTLVRAGAVGLWAQTNYQQLTALFRVEERSVAYAIASIANVLITVVAMVLAVAVFNWGATGLVVGNFVGTLAVYLVLVAYRREQLGLQFDRKLFRQMQTFGMPLVPSALALWAISFIDREFVAYYNGRGEVGIYSAAIKVASVITFVMLAFRTAWPAFAYSIEDDREAKRTYAFVLTYLLAAASWAALALGALAPWLVSLLTSSQYHRAEKGVALLAFGFAIYAGYTVLAIGSGRARQDAAQLGGDRRRRRRERRPQLLADPALRDGRRVDLDRRRLRRAVHRHDACTRNPSTPCRTSGAASSRRSGRAVGLTVLARAPHLGLAPSFALVLVYPIVLALLGFYLPAERAPPAAARAARALTVTVTA